MNAIIFWLSFVVLVFLTLIFPSAANKVPIQPKPGCACVRSRVCKKLFLRAKVNENPLLVSRFMCWCWSYWINLFKFLITRAPKHASCTTFPKLFMTVTSPTYLFFLGGGVGRVLSGRDLWR